jgi:protein-disulfide isomerase
MISRAGTLLSIFVFMLGCCLAVNAQDQSETAATRPEQDLSSLREEVQTLQSQQREILSELNDLKLLLARPPARPASALPFTVNVQGEKSRGDSGASVAMIEYADFECPFCGKYAREVYPKILDEYVKTGKVKLFFRDLPLPMHPHAMAAAHAARCAGEQGKYWEMHDSLFAKQAALSDPALSDRAQTLGLDTSNFKDCFSSGKYADEIQKSLSEAEKLGVRGTPTFFLGTVDPNGDVVKIGKIIVGARPYETFKAALDDLLGSKSQATNSSQ